MVNLKKIMAAAAIAGAFGFTALGMGAGIAKAVPVSATSPVTPATLWAQDDGWWWGPGHGHGHGRGWDGPGGWGPGWYGGGPGWYGGGPGWYGGPGVGACVSATGPWGFVTGTACI
jgi:hypothetical protein